MVCGIDVTRTLFSYFMLFPCRSGLGGERNCYCSRVSPFGVGLALCARLLLLAGHVCPSRYRRLVQGEQGGGLDGWK